MRESHFADISRLWMLKLTISEFFKRLTLNIWRRSYEWTLQFIRWFLVVTFIAVIISDIAECQPITHYWQVVPDPGGKCRQGYAQLLTMGTANIITDLLLVVFPIPIIINSKMGAKQKIQLTLLFAGSLLPAGTTLYRLPNIVDRHGSQQYRSLLASVEILFATAVANALVLGSFIRDKGVKKQRWKLGSMNDSVERTTSRRGTAVRHWGSDEDLVRDLGLGVDPELRDNPTQSPRPAPMAVAGNTPTKAHKMALEREWHYPQTETGEPSDASDEMDFVKAGEHNHSPGEGSSTVTARKVSFLDVGGLLDEERYQERRGSSTRTTDTELTSLGESSNHGQLPSHSSWGQPHGVDGGVDGLSPAPTRRGGSTALLQDIGGLLGPRPRREQPSRGYELQTILQESERPQPESLLPPNLSRMQTTLSLQDVGGLLR